MKTYGITNFETGSVLSEISEDKYAILTKSDTPTSYTQSFSLSRTTTPIVIGPSIYNHISPITNEYEQDIPTGTIDYYASLGVVRFYEEFSEFPPVEDGEEDVLYVDKGGSVVYIFNNSLKTYIPISGGGGTGDIDDAIHAAIQVINGGTARTVD